MAKRHLIFGVHITDRVKHVPEVQKIFTQYGCNIRTRLGLHEDSPQACSPNGLILLETVGDEAKCDEMAAKLRKIQGVEVQKMVFEHP